MAETAATYLKKEKTKIGLKHKYMILHEGILYIETKDLIECGKTRQSIDKEVKKGNKLMGATKIPALGCGNYFEWEKMGGTWRECIQQRYPNPYDMVARQPILKMVQAKPEADAFYHNYTYTSNNNTKNLPKKTILKYIRESAWLTMIHDVVANPKMITKGLHLSIPQFYEHVQQLMELEKSNGKNEEYMGLLQLSSKMPTTYQRLRERAKLFNEKGYSSIIDSMWGNKLSAKIGKTAEGYNAETAATQEAVIRRLAGLHMNLDAMQITEKANLLFEKNGMCTIGHQTVANIMAKYMPMIKSARNGAKVYNNEVAMQVKRVAPKYPTYYFTLDGWTAELLYQNKERFDNRLCMVVVLDPCCKYPVGYAIGERENTELIRQALRNAIAHLNSLFGNYYRPYQIQSDRYGIKNLTPFYSSVAHLHTPAAVGNAKSKVVEPYFKYLNKKYCQLQYNWSGFGITARKENQVNAEYINKIKHSLPQQQDVVNQLQQMMEIERSTKIETYKALWNEMPAEDKQVLSKEDLLMVFGKEHNHTNSITGQGIKATIEGQSITYNSFDANFRSLMYTNKFKLVYDEQDLSHVLAVTEDGKQRFLLHKSVEIAMDIKGTTPAMLDYRQQINDYNRSRKQEIIELYANDFETVEELVANTPLQLTNANELALKTMLTIHGQQKERLQDAKGLAKVQKQERKQLEQFEQQQQKTWQQQQTEFMMQRSHANEYL